MHKSVLSKSIKHGSCNVSRVSHQMSSVDNQINVLYNIANQFSNITCNIFIEIQNTQGTGGVGAWSEEVVYKKQAL